MNQNQGSAQTHTRPNQKVSEASLKMSPIAKFGTIWELKRMLAIN
jgi:hypothetical protein